MSIKPSFATRLEECQKKATRIAEASGEPVMNFDDFSHHHSKGRLAFAATERNNMGSLLWGGILGAGFRKSIFGHSYEGILGALSKDIAAGAVGAGFIAALDALFAPSKPERDLVGYEKYLNDRAAQVFEKPSMAEAVQMGLFGGNLGRGL